MLKKLASKAQPKYEKHAMKMALKIFENLDDDKMTDIEDKLVESAIIAHATPKVLADFADEGPENQKIIFFSGTEWGKIETIKK